MTCNKTNVPIHQELTKNNNVNVDLVETSCFPFVYNTPPDSIKSTTPILSEYITDCVSFSNGQYLRSSPITFTIDDSSVNFQNNSRISINNVTYSYKCLGLTLPLSYYLCDNMNTFKTDGAGCPCTTNSMPSEIQNEISTTISSANKTISTAKSVLSSTTINAKNNSAVSASESLGTTLSDAATSVNSIINYFVQDQTVKQAMIYLATANERIASALELSADILDGINTGTVTQIENLIYDAGDINNSAVGLINQAADTVIGYTGVPAQAKTAANIAKTGTSNAQNDVINLQASPTFTDVNNIIYDIYLAASYAYSSIYYLIQYIGDTSLQPYLNSLYNTIYGIFLFQYSVQAINDSTSSSYDDIEIIHILDSAAQAIIDAANYAKQAVNYSNTLTEINLYNDFKDTLTPCKCRNLKCCCINSDAAIMKQLFYHPIYSYQICDLKIAVSGTIGSEEFSASVSYPGNTKLEDLGFDGFQVAGPICIPLNSYFTLRENFNPCFTVECVIPDSKYNANSAPPYNTFTASIYCYFKLDTNISVSVNKPIAAVTTSVHWQC